MYINKNILENHLPICAEGIIIRQLNRKDLDLLINWPPYPWPNDVFRFSFCNLTSYEMDKFYEKRKNGHDRIYLTADIPEIPAIGYIALLDIDWSKRIAGNMSFRIHPEHCSKGIGTVIMRSISNWWFGLDMNALRLDVAAPNHRAVKCYLKTGFKIIGEFWGDAPDLKDKDLSEKKYCFLNEHVNLDKQIPQIRFYLMESVKAHK